MNNRLYHNAAKKVTDLLYRPDKLYNKNVLIAGATGMIGSVIIDCLMDANRRYGLGIKVTALARSEQSARQRFKAYWNCKDFRFVSGDVNQKIPDIGVPSDYIIHGAGNTHPLAYSLDPVGTITCNVIGAYNLLEYARKCPASRFVFLSSVEIYGENRGKTHRFAEDSCGYIDCNTARAGYPEGKRTGESLCCSYKKQHGIDFVIPRLCRIYGPTMRPDDSKALSQFIKNAVYGQDIVLKSKGDQLFSYLFVFDAVSAIFTIMLDGVSGQAYNVSSELSDITLKDLAQRLAALAGSRVVFDLPSDIERQGYSTASKALLDNSKLKALGWSEQFTLEEGLEITINCLRNQWNGQFT